MSEFVLHLPSNVQPTRFPSNTASNFSTQLDQSIELEGGDWEAALTEVSYPKSIKVFDDEGITFARTEHTRECGQSGKVRRKTIMTGGTIEKLCMKLNDVAPLIFSASYNEKEGFKLEVHVAYHIVHFPQNLQHLLGLKRRDFLMGATYGKKGLNEIVNKRAQVKVTNLDCMVREDITVKKKGVSLKTVPEVLETVNKNLERHGLILKITNDLARIVKTGSMKKGDLATVFSKEFREALGFPTLRTITHRGTYVADKRLSMDVVSKSTDDWVIVTYTRQHRKGSRKRHETYWKVRPPRDNTLGELVTALNEKSEDYAYTFRHKNGRILLSVLAEDLELILDQSLAELLGFHQRHFSEVKIYRALRPPTLHRNIDYVFIYSNILDYVNVGHMTAPLLHAVPFMKHNNGLLIHHSIRSPIYRPIKTSKLDRIDIRLCDGNGEDIPFCQGKSLMVLNIRRRIL